MCLQHHHPQLQIDRGLQEEMLSNNLCMDEDSANRFTRAASLHQHGKCGVEDVDSGMRITATYISN